MQQSVSALEYPTDRIAKMMAINYTGVFISARACAREMNRYKTPGAMCLVASMSGNIANKGFLASVYISSKAAVQQLTRNLAMEWSRVQEDGTGGIRVNSLSPGYIRTPMVEENLRKNELNLAEMEVSTMLGRISRPEEFKGVGLFLLSNASSFVV